MVAGFKRRIDKKEIVSAPTAHREMTPVEVVAAGLVIFGALVALAGYPGALFGSPEDDKREQTRKS